MGWRKGWMLVLLITALWMVMAGPGGATLDDDHYDGNIFALYGSNGGMIPPRVSLADSLARQMPTLLVFYIDDSKDCKHYAPVIANLQVRYGLGVNVLAYAVDSLDLDDPQGPGRYFSGQVPQTLLFDPQGQIVYRAVGDRPILEVENAIRKVFALGPVDPATVQAQPFNEVQTGFGSQAPARKAGRRGGS